MHECWASFRCAETDISRAWLSLCMMIEKNHRKELKAQRDAETYFWPVSCLLSSSTKSHLWKSRVDTERDYPWDQVQCRRQDPLQLCDGICFGGACSAHVHSEPGSGASWDFPAPFCRGKMLYAYMDRWVKKQVPQSWNTVTTFFLRVYCMPQMHCAQLAFHFQLTNEPEVILTMILISLFFLFFFLFLTLVDNLKNYPSIFQPLILCRVTGCWSLS